MNEQKIQLITQNLFEETARKAGGSPRLRMNHNFHESPTENPQRFLNVLLRDTYIRPHRHCDPPKAETFLVLEGAAAVILFSNSGKITGVHQLGATTAELGHIWGIDIAPGVWHTILPVTPRAVCFEVKPGPWNPITDKDFASWAPREDDSAKENYLRNLKADSGLHDSLS